MTQTASFPDYALDLGSSRVTLFAESTGAGSAELFFADAADDDPVCASVATPVRFPNGCLLIESDAQTILVDTGTGEHTLERLVSLGVEPDDVEIVVVTHGHADHVSGLVAGEQPAFPRARYLMNAAERRFWIDPATRNAVVAEAPFHDVAVDVLSNALPILEAGGQLNDLQDGDEIAPGIQAVAAFGHTPFHMGIRITDGNTTVLHLGDLVSHRLHVESELLPIWDLPRASQVAETRRRLFERAVNEQAIVTVSHVPMPGRIVRSDNGFSWVDLETTVRQPTTRPASR